MSTFDMKTLRLRSVRLFPRLHLILLALLFLAVGCAPQAAPTAFRPPTAIPPIQPSSTSTPPPATPSPEITLTPTSTAGPCSNELTFLDDLTVEDGATFAPGESIDKQWLVQNDGTCDWDASYKLKWVGGYPLGVDAEQPLYPARAGVQAALRIVFTAPTEPGLYQTTWQAVDSQGNLFGEMVYMEIVVQ